MLSRISGARICPHRLRCNTPASHDNNPRSDSTLLDDGQIRSPLSAEHSKSAAYRRFHQSDSAVLSGGQSWSGLVRSGASQQLYMAGKSTICP